jgi:3-(3-hydroxy-phenyl)propionate hydroxylase
VAAFAKSLSLGASSEEPRLKNECDLLIVGLGPIGDVCAGLAALEGLHVIAIDRETAPYPLPRAAVFDDEIMRIFQRVGVAERLEDICWTPDRHEFISSGGEVLADFPVKGISTPSGWEPSYVLHQPAVEALLRQRLEELRVDVRLGERFISVHQEPDAAVATVERGDGRYQVRAAYLVGADGGSSSVRQAINGDLFDYEFDEPWLVIDVVAPIGNALPLRGMQICDPVRPASYLKMPGDRFRWEFLMLPGETVGQVTAEAFIRELLQPWGVSDDIIIERKAVYRFRGLLAKRWREGRVLLAGDAAHQMPPFAGQGMCSGLRDANNLIWKVACVQRKEADVALLDSYQAERELHARSVIETAITMGRIVCLRDAEAAAARDAKMIALRLAGTQELSMRFPDLVGGCLDGSAGSGSQFPQPVVKGWRLDDVLGPGFWLIGRDLPKATAVNVSIFDLAGQPLLPFAPALNAWLASMNAQAVIVRPDRHVFGTGSATALLARLEERLRNIAEVV